MRDFAKGLYSSQRWQDTRAAYMSSVCGLCEDCLAKGIYKPAAIVHHIEHVEPWNIDNPEITLSWNNLRAVCRECHAQEHSDMYHKKNFKNKKRYRVFEDGSIKIFDDSPLGSKKNCLGGDR